MNITTATAQELTKLAKHINEANRNWWETPDGNRIKRDPLELLMLVVTEIAEATEGERKDLMDDHLPHRKMAEVEMADAVIRILDFMGGFNHQFFDGKFMFYLPSNKAAALFAITASVTECYRSNVVDKCLTKTLQMIVNYCDINGYDLDAAVTEKVAYNKTRADHTHEERAKTNGKKF